MVFFRNVTSAGWNGRRGNSSGGDGAGCGVDEQRVARSLRRRVGHARSEGCILSCGFGAGGERKRKEAEAAMMAAKA